MSTPEPTSDRTSTTVEPLRGMRWWWVFGGLVLAVLTGDAAMFRRAEFDNGAMFDGARFNGTATFARARFAGPASFDPESLRGESWFDDCRIAAGGPRTWPDGWRERPADNGGYTLVRTT